MRCCSGRVIKTVRLEPRKDPFTSKAAGKTILQGPHISQRFAPIEQGEERRLERTTVVQKDVFRLQIPARKKSNTSGRKFCRIKAQPSYRSQFIDISLVFIAWVLSILGLLQYFVWFNNQFIFTCMFPLLNKMFYCTELQSSSM